MPRPAAVDGAYPVRLGMVTTARTVRDKCRGSSRIALPSGLISASIASNMMAPVDWLRELITNCRTGLPPRPERFLRTCRLVPTASDGINVSDGANAPSRRVLRMGQAPRRHARAQTRAVASGLRPTGCPYGDIPKKDQVTVRRARDERTRRRSYRGCRRRHSRSPRPTRSPGCWPTGTRTKTSSMAYSERR